jgi:aminopeptidase YwaD
MLRPGLTPEEGITAPLAYIGKAFEQDFRDIDCRGKIVFSYEDIPFEGPTSEECNFLIHKTQNAYNAGAVGFIFTNRRRDDFIQTWGLHRDLDKIPSVSVPFGEFLKLRDRVQSGKLLKAHLTCFGQVKKGYSEVVYGIQKGTEKPDRTVVISGSHHETPPGAGGANDNASGIAVMLELARFFSKYRTKKSIVFLSSCGEESGTWGNIEFVKQRADVYGPHCEGVFIIDMINSSENGMLAGPKKGLKTDKRLNKMLERNADALGYHLPVIDDPRITRGGLGDSQGWVERGIPAVFIDGYHSDYFYHTDGDLPPVINPNVMKSIADPVALTVMQLDED